MEALKWNNDRMGVDIELIDSHHKELLHIINDLATTIEENSQKDDILGIVNRIIKYAHYHFSIEEAFFERFHYDDSEAHKEEHNKFFKDFEEIRDELKEIDGYRGKSVIRISEDVFEYITTWFVQHVTGSDRKYVKLFKEHGIK